MKVVFAPIGILAGLIAGIAAKKTFERVWAVIDDEDPPEPERRDVGALKLVAALALEGAIFRVAKGFAERGARSGFTALTGRWPGEDYDTSD